MPKKLILGWFTFTCSEDSTILMTEILNSKWQEWQKFLEFKYAKILRQSGPLGPMDIAFVEGAISSEEQATKLKRIRLLSKTLVAVGACAVTGYPSAQRNLFNSEQKAAIGHILEKFSYSPAVRKLSDIVRVDYSLPGCPMDENKFIELIENLCTKQILISH